MAERPSLRLPAPPPAKRQRVDVVVQQEAETVAPVRERSPGAAPAAPIFGPLLTDDVAAEPDVPEALPNDAMVALLLLKSRFPLEAKVIPFATRSQLYTLLSDRTEADRQVEELRRANRIRLIQLPGGARGGEEHALMLTEDYVAALRRCRAVLLQNHRQSQQQQQQQQQTGSGSGSTASSSAAGTAGSAAAQAEADQPPGIEAFGWFAVRVLPACTEMMITHGELLALLGRGSSKPGAACPAGAPRACQGTAAGTPAARRAACATLPSVTDAHVSLLLSCGFLVRHTAAADSYLFGMPQAGTAVRSVAAGRQEILSLLQRRRQPELLEAELVKRRLQRSVLGVRWHVADMLGSGALLRLATPVGPLLRIARRGG